MITVDKYLECVESIYIEQPEYRTGGDGSDGTCDCIGMCRGALDRAGAENVKNMRGTNQAARKTIKNLQPIKKAEQLRKGDVVLKLRDKDDPDMKLPDQYRKGGSEYDPEVGEKNYTHIGTVTKEYPDLEITHMTSPTAKKDHSLGNWKETGYCLVCGVRWMVIPESMITVKDCWFADGNMLVFEAYGSATEKTKVIVTNNCMENLEEDIVYNSGSSDNMTIMSWNNYERE